MKHIILFSSVSIFAATLSSCVPLAVGATAGYVAHDQGYRLQSPIKKSESEEKYEEMPQGY
jgi:hypothetical protein